ncbi:MAG: hypothetical protein ACXW4P_11825 [Thermoanaerobaculia bacterium]
MATRSEGASLVLFNQIMCALRFSYCEVLDRPDVVERTCYARHERWVPVVLSVEEIDRVTPLD